LEYIANIIYGLAGTLQVLYHLYMLVIIGSVILSWVNADPYNMLVRTIRSCTDPVFTKIRQNIPYVMMGGLDLSPLVLILILQFANYAVIENLFLLASRMR